MTDMAVIEHRSPFDAIRHLDDRGEHWSARELMPVMGYGADWRNFVAAIDRAKVACQNTGIDPANNFGDATKVAQRGPAAADYRLTRYAAYLVAMNGDPRKVEIAAAQTYFAVKTREAEARQELDELEVARRYVALLEERKAIEVRATVAEERLALAAPKAAYVDAFIERTDVTTIRVFAGQLGVGEQALRAYLVARGVLYRRLIGHYWSRSQQKRVPEYEWLAHSRYAAWFVTKDQPQAPRMHNDQVRTTLYVRPQGKAGITAMLARRPIVGQDDLDVGEGL